MISVRFLPAAEIELLREIVYYSKARPGTGVRFQAAVEATVKRAATHPLGGAPSFKETSSILNPALFPLNPPCQLADNPLKGLPDIG